MPMSSSVQHEKRRMSRKKSLRSSAVWDGGANQRLSGLENRQYELVFVRSRME